jgi:succinyl-diaminopimelate desuccinylase
MVADALVSGDTEIARLRSTLGDVVSRSSHQIIDLARSLVAVPSAYPPGDTHAVADRIESMCEGSGAEVERFGTLPHVMNLVVRVRGARPGRRLVFNGHLAPFHLSTPINGRPIRTVRNETGSSTDWAFRT